MLLDRNPETSGVIIDFETETEVAAVRSAFEEHAAHLISLGNESSVTDYQKDVINEWEGPNRRYRGSNHRLMTERLSYFVEVTEERVEEILAEADNPDRIADSARRYSLGHAAAGLLESIGLQASMEEDWSEILDDQP